MGQPVTMERGAESGWSAGEGQPAGRTSWTSIAGFIVLTFLLAWPGDDLDSAFGGLHFAASAVAHLLALVVLVPVLALFRSRLPNPHGWIGLALVVVLARGETLLTQSWFDGDLAHVGHIAALSNAHLILLEVASPLWLAVLASLQIVPERVPRAVVGCTIGAMAAVCLMLPDNQMTLRLESLPVLLLAVALGFGMVWIWSYARRQLTGVSPLAAGVCAVVLYIAVDGLLSVATERAAWQPVDWRGSWVPLLSGTLRTAGAAWLWYWLLSRMQLAAFAMLTTAIWLSGMFYGRVFFGPLGWRWNVAFPLGVAAVVVAFRAREQDEEPVTLGLP